MTIRTVFLALAFLVPMSTFTVARADEAGGEKKEKKEKKAKKEKKEDKKEEKK